MESSLYNTGATSNGTRILGIDYGTKKVGIALGSGGIAFPKMVVKNDATLIDVIGNLCEQEEVSEIVLGESKNEKGEYNPVMKEILKFKTILEEKLGLPVVLEQEFMTSVYARDFKSNMEDDGRRYPDKKRELIDASAAALVLQRYLDRKGR